MTLVLYIITFNTDVFRNKPELKMELNNKDIMQDLDVWQYFK